MARLPTLPRDWPWFPDFQGRLLRNDAQLWFPGLCHSSVALTMPARYLDEVSITSFISNPIASSANTRSSATWECGRRYV